ncbi:MAG: squalene/phytoene synthase family protein [Gammaproteobacteria bacterium]|nr:squalene/phytoene synthase family protein [Gammaproteobacteria bacterium]MDH3768713.1 squalene/phytoene synthase family protein [Gammaproteobacteria bacterium]
MPAESAIPAASYVSAAIPPNSIDHFVLMMTAHDQRPVVAASLTLGKVIGNITAQVGEPEIQQLKLNWWLEEIQMIEGDRPRHPLTVDLSNTVTHKQWLAPLHALVIGTLGDVGQPPLRTLADCLNFCHNTAERQALVATVLPQCDELALTNARAMGVGISLTEAIRDLPNPDSRIPVKGLSTETGFAGAAELAEIAKKHFGAVESGPREQIHAQLSVYLQSRLYERLLARLQTHDYNPDKTSMHAIASLWQAWREARRLIQ